ncbi:MULTISPECIES: hypothetical protein [unclassified Clostridioides]
MKCNINDCDYIIETVHGDGNLRLQNNFNGYIVKAIHKGYN